MELQAASAAITGRTRLVAILADPIGHVRTPQALNPLYAATASDAVCVPWHVSPDGLASAVAAARALHNLDGLIITVPHKTAIVGLVDSLAPQAALVGAANVVRRHPDGRLEAEIFDGRGFVAGLRATGHEAAGCRTLLVGAGGAAAAIAFALAEAGVAALTLANRTANKAAALAAAVAAAYPTLAISAGSADPAGYDLVVNATSLGLREKDPLPLAVERLTAGTLVADVIMQPEETALLSAAAGRGCRVHRGRHMLDAQLALILEFLGHAAAAEAVRSARFSPLAGGSAQPARRHSG